MFCHQLIIQINQVTCKKCFSCSGKFHSFRIEGKMFCLFLNRTWKLEVTHRDLLLQHVCFRIMFCNLMCVQSFSFYARLSKSQYLMM